MSDFKPLTGILGPVEETNTAWETQLSSTTEEKGTQSLAAEAKEGVGSNDSKIMAVQTRAQRQKELSRNQKQRQAAAKQQDTRTIANLTPQQLQDAQKEDNTLNAMWRAAEEGKGGYLIKGQTLYHRGRDEWGEDTHQLCSHPIKI